MTDQDKIAYLAVKAKQLKDKHCVVPILVEMVKLLEKNKCSGSQN
jgi:hypothetical protein